MLSWFAQIGCRICSGERWRALTRPRVRMLGLLLALLFASPIVAASSALTAAPSVLPPLPRVDQPTPTTVQLVSLRVPGRPVEALDRTDFSVAVANPGGDSLKDVTVELTILGPDGRAVLDVRERGLTLRAYDSQQVYWEWRVPGNLDPGQYVVRARALDSSGRVLSGQESISAPLRIVARTGFVPQHNVSAQYARASPYLCGVNLDPQLADRLAVAKQMGVTTVRFPPDASYRKNLALLKAAGLQPMIILDGLSISDPAERLATNERLVREAQQVFGANTRLFYEIGNESDLAFHLDASGYTAMWNAMVPRLKALAPDSWFGGPVNFQSNPLYVASFVHGATPRPDFISWHEYACPSSSSASACLESIARWATHVSSTRDAIQANGDIVPPMMVTEWNYAPDQGVTTDDKHNDPVFLTRWTTMALRALIDNQIYGAYQFNVYGVLPLLGSAQGQAFENFCRPISAGGASSIPLPAASAQRVVSSEGLAPATGALRPPAPAPGPIIARDTFQRPDQAFWGTASDGQTWGGAANTDSVFSVRNGTGQVMGGNGAFDAILGPVATDAEVWLVGSMSSFRDTNFGAVLRWNDTDNWYKAYLDGSGLVIQKKANGSYTVLGSAPFRATPDTSYALRFRAVGTILSAKVWPAGQPEPPDWMVTVTDGTFASGRIGVRSQVLGGVTVTYASFEAYRLSSPSPPPITTTIRASPSSTATATRPASGATATAPAAEAVIDVKALNVHRGPGIGDAVIASVHLGERYRVSGESSDRTWVEICCVRGQAGWVEADLVRVAPGGGQPGSEGLPTPTAPAALPSATPTAGRLAEAVVAVPSLNVHRGPGLGYPVLVSVHRGERYRVIDQTVGASWLDICCVDGQSGWVEGDLVTVIRVTTTPLPTPTPTPTVRPPTP